MCIKTTVDQMLEGRNKLGITFLECHGYDGPSDLLLCINFI